MRRQRNREPIKGENGDIDIKVKLADKPGSVVDSHSSRRFVT